MDSDNNATGPGAGDGGNGPDDEGNGPDGAGNGPDGEGASDSRELGVEIGPLASELESHDYPTTSDELVDEYGDYEVEFSDGTETVASILGTLEGVEERYESPDEVRQTILNLVQSGAVGREEYTDRGGMPVDGDKGGGEDDEQESF